MNESPASSPVSAPAPARRSVWTKRWPSLAAGGGAVAFVALLHAAGVFENLELESYDARVRLTADPAAAHPDIALVMIGQSSLEIVARESPDSGEWPWTRDYYEPVVRFCRQGGARAILFDLFFTERSRNGDDALGRACRREKPGEAGVFMAADFSPDADPGSPAIPPRFAVRAAVADGVRLPEYGYVRLPVDDIAGGVTGVGDVVLDPGGRYQAPLCRYRGGVYPSLAFAAYLDLRLPGYFDRPFDERPVLTVERSGALVVPCDPPVRIPLDREGRMLLSHRVPQRKREGRGPDGRPAWRETYARYEIAHVIDAWYKLEEPAARVRVAPGGFRGKFVLVGSDYEGIDTRTGPFGEWGGPMFHAAALDTLLRGDFGTRWPRTATVALMAGLGLAVTALTWLRPFLLGAAGTALLLAGHAGFAVLALHPLGAWIEVIAPVTAGIFAYAAAATANFLLEEKERRFAGRAFEHFVPPAVARKILAHPETLRLGGERRELSIFFSDLAGFTSLSEVMAPDALFATLNEYLDRMTEVIHESHGTLDKYVGDAVVAFWNAPESQPDHAILACRAALASQRELQAFRARLKASGLPDFNARIGLNTGPVTVGFVGARKRFQYTVLGDDANLASRLEGANKGYGSSILISEATFAAARPAIAARELDLLRVLGKQKPVRVYELAGLAGDATDDLRKLHALFAEGLALYRERRWDDARLRFEAVLGIAPDDGPAKAYVKRCDRFAAEPPPADWDGVYAMKDK